MVTIETLLELLALHGGKIVSTASLSPEWIEQARSSGRMYVDNNSLGYVWEPDIQRFPENEAELDWINKWYPNPVEIPERLKDPSFLFNEGTKSRCCGRCDGVNDICVADQECETHNITGCELCFGSQKAVATPPPA